jgi:aerobic carbon-monoxide dehydrogenase medium subunit
MKPSPFIFHEPKTLRQAIALLAEVVPQDGRILAGGQTLVPAMALRLARPTHLVDINRVEGLDRLLLEDGALCIGARVRHAAFHRPVEAGTLGRLLAAVVRHIGHYPIRTRGTFCGSLANADPASEWCLVAVTLDAVLVVESTRGRRTIAAADFFQGFLMTALEPDELLVEARLPVLPPETRFGFNEFSRRAGDFAQAMALTAFALRDGLIADPRLGTGGVEGAPRRLTEAEAYLSSRPPSRQVFKEAADAAADAVSPIEDSPETVSYKRDLIRAVTFRALAQAGELT